MAAYLTFFTYFNIVGSECLGMLVVSMAGPRPRIPRAAVNPACPEPHTGRATRCGSLIEAQQGTGLAWVQSYSVWNRKPSCRAPRLCSRLLHCRHFHGLSHRLHRAGKLLLQAKCVPARGWAMHSPEHTWLPTGLCALNCVGQRELEFTSMTAALQCDVRRALVMEVSWIAINLTSKVSQHQLATPPCGVRTGLRSHPTSLHLRCQPSAKCGPLLTHYRRAARWRSTTCGTEASGSTWWPVSACYAYYVVRYRMTLERSEMNACSWLSTHGCIHAGSMHPPLATTPAFVMPCSPRCCSAAHRAGTGAEQRALRCHSLQVSLVSSKSGGH